LISIEKVTGILERDRKSDNPSFSSAVRPV
jgi:hypothetical protein